MKKLILFFIFITHLFCASINNGELEIITIDANFAKNLTINDKFTPWLKHPTKPGFMIAFIPVDCNASGVMSIKNTINDTVGHTEFVISKKDYKTEDITSIINKFNIDDKTAELIKKEKINMQKIYNTVSGDIYFNSNFIKPLNSFVTSEFGSIRVANGSFNHYHNGMDFRAKVGQKVISSNSGIVRVASFKHDSGHSVVIDHGGGIYTQYFHLSKIFVKPGIKVAKGDVLGLSGASGILSGPHLHFGVVVNGVQVNPSVFIEKTDNLFN